MRKVTRLSVDALLNGKPFSMGNTKVVPNALGSRLDLHGHAIAYKSHLDGRLYIDTCGYMTNTTKERLNGLPGVSIVQRKGVWYLNGEPWDGNVTQIK